MAMLRAARACVMAARVGMAVLGSEAIGSTEEEERGGEEEDFHSANSGREKLYTLALSVTYVK